MDTELRERQLAELRADLARVNVKDGFNDRGRIEDCLESYVISLAADFYKVPPQWIRTGDPKYGPKVKEYYATFKYLPDADITWVFRCNEYWASQSEVKLACEHYLKAVEILPIDSNSPSRKFKLINAINHLLSSDTFLELPLEPNPRPKQ